MLTDADLLTIIDSATANVGKVIGSDQPLWIATMTKDDLLALARRVADAATAAERTRILAALGPVTDLLADMHDDGEDCRFQGGEGCLACMMFDLLGMVLKELTQEDSQ